jgi:hypothetical protein
MLNPDKQYGFGSLYTWPRSIHVFEYDGLCSHSSLREAVVGDLHLTAEQLDAIASTQAEQERVYGLEYARNLRANPTEQLRETQRNNNIKQKAGTKARQQQAIASGTYACRTCNVNNRDAAMLRRHNDTPRHKKKLIMGDDDYHCDYCDISFQYKSNYSKHLESKSHLAKSNHCAFRCHRFVPSLPNPDLPGFLDIDYLLELDTPTLYHHDSDCINGIVYHAAP